MTKETVFSRAKLIELTAKTLNNGRNDYNSIPVQLVTQIINAYQSVIDSAIQTANQLDQMVIVKPLTGIKIISHRQPEYIKKVCGEPVVIPEKTNLTAKVSTDYKSKINKTAEKE